MASSVHAEGSQRTASREVLMKIKTGRNVRQQIALPLAVFIGSGVIDIQFILWHITFWYRLDEEG